MNYTLGYSFFGLLFVVGVVAYWTVSRALRNPTEIYETGETGEADRVGKGVRGSDG